jgi:flavin-binding protein dodecin
MSADRIETGGKMLRMIEVVGQHPDGYTEAVRSALEKLVDEGRKVHFFTITEQRGAVRDGRITEFQAVVKVAVES